MWQNMGQVYSIRVRRAQQWLRLVWYAEVIRMALRSRERTNAICVRRSPEELYSEAVRAGIAIGLRRVEARRLARELTRHFDVLEVDLGTGAVTVRLGPDLFAPAESELHGRPEAP